VARKNLVRNGCRQNQFLMCLGLRSLISTVEDDRIFLLTASLLMMFFVASPLMWAAS